MLDLTVDDDDGLDARLHDFDTALDFRDHAARDRAVADELTSFFDPELRNEAAFLVEYALDVGQQ